ncbi:hypothetical protein L1987_48205 [Smallanthus sonchifolius]|uniref:Uncharacterized protein n=1 Tax=Smallanthus sonchifolius TaxID=185202 RepID=A0ACB9FS79_9ASTR|nr:hypothetical protein L1987_48205 [Smallanthus sonchifolius]
MHPVQKSNKLNNVHNKDTMGNGKKINGVYSGPFMPLGGSVEDMLKEHDRQIQAAIRKAHAESVRIGVGELKAQSKAQGPLIVRKYNPQEENGFAYYNSEIQKSVVEKLTNNLKDDVVGTSLRMVLSHMDPALKMPMTNMHRVQESTKLNNVRIKDKMGNGKKTNRVYSRPLMPPDGSIEDMLKETKVKLKQQLGKHMQPWPKVVRHKT